MQKLTLKLDCLVFYGENLINYLTSLKGINLVKIAENKGEIYVEYDGDIISLKVLKYEILYCLSLLKIPSIIGFRKYYENNLLEYTIIIKDLCCEYCLKGMIEDLLEIDGINSAYTDFNCYTKKDVNIYITYNSKLLSLKQIREIEMVFNGV